MAPKCMSIRLIITTTCGYNPYMIDMPQQVAEWAKRLNKSELTKELVGVMYCVPKSEREKVLAAVVNQRESPLRYCADSIISHSAAMYRDGLKHLATGTDSLLAMAPSLAPTFDSFCPSNARTHEDLPIGVLHKVMSSLCLRHDLPSDFLFDPVLEARFLPEMHGLMIAALAGCGSDVDLEWLGNNRQQLAPYADTLYEHGNVAREFCEHLLSQKSPALSPGTL